MSAASEFKRRFRITGELVTYTPLHIGSGNERFLRLAEDKNVELVAVSAVIRDLDAKPYIPGASLRGVIKAWMEQSGTDESVLREIFGSGETGREQGGRLYVHGGFFNPLQSQAPDWPSKPDSAVLERHFWDVRRWVQIANGVAVNRFTRTAAHHKLFYYEITPPQTVFNICIDAEDISDESLAWIMAALNSFNLPYSGCRLGAGQSIGYGHCRWDAAKMKIAGLTDADQRQTWLHSDCLNAGCSGYPQVERAFIEKLPSVDAKPEDILGLEIELRFDGPMSVNDISRLNENKSGPNEQPDHAFYTDHRDRVMLPARSVRGALRAQSEKIVRTMAEARAHGFRPDPETLKELACYPHSGELACQPVHDMSETGKLCLTCCLFGAGGWRSPVWIGDFSAIDTGADLFQEFVAIDRFTGGSADEMKFNALAKYQPVFRGALAIDLARTGPTRLGLLCLLMRDLIEGDIQFGFGRAKGYGACTASIVKINPPAQYPRFLSGLADLVKTAPEKNSALLWTEAVRAELRPLVLELEQYAASINGGVK